jgi:signal transduction histidine kinase
MSTTNDPEPPRRPLRVLLRPLGALLRTPVRLTALPRDLLLAVRRGSARQAPTWRHAAREASDVRSLQDALERLASAPAELVVGPEPPLLPPGGGRLGRRLRPYRAPILWLATAAMFWLTSQMLLDLGRPFSIALVLGALISLPLGLAATRPLSAWRLQVVVAAVAPVLVPQQDLPWPAPLAWVALYVLYVAAARLQLHLVVGVWLVSNATIVLGYVATGARRDAISEVYFTVILVTAVVAFGYLFGTRRRLQQEVVEGRQRRDQEHARSALLEERARIARELHDIVAHHMSVIAVRTETAPFRIPELPEAAKDDLAETSAIAREALTEMRRLLGVLRGADDGAEHAPQPGMEQLGTLVAAVRGAGLAVDLHVVGAERPLPSGVELSAYRIVQEALSNTLRHAPGARATVEVGYERDRLRLRVRNDAPSVRRDRPRPSQPGQGIIGMRERAAMLGGELAAGATPQGGYLVEAVLPLDGHHDQTEPA